MKLTKVLLLAAAPLLSLSVVAQDSSESGFTLAATLGYNSYTSIAAPSPTETSYSVQSLTNTWQDKNLMVGIEVGYMLPALIKVSAGGGVNFTRTPGYSEIEGTMDDGDVYEAGDIPTYKATDETQSFAFDANLGVDKYFKVSKVNKLMWFLGARGGYSYAQNQVKVDDEDALGNSVAETANFRGALEAGAQYTLFQGFYVGLQCDIASFTYNRTSIQPQAGLDPLEADGTSIGGFSAPTIKIGFQF